jgi:hypothetical protein
MGTPSPRRTWLPPLSPRGSASGHSASHRDAGRVTRDRGELPANDRGQLGSLVGRLDDHESQALVVRRVPGHLTKGRKRQRRAAFRPRDRGKVLESATPSPRRAFAEATLT